MSRRRFYAPPEAFAPDGASVTLAPEEARHLRDVLRLQAGAEAYVFDGAENEYLCRVTNSGRKGNDVATLVVQEQVAPPHAEPALRLTLAVALLKGEKFDLVVQKATELGVTEIMPVLTKRADVRLRDASDATHRTARWQRLALEAAKQSGRAFVPQISAPLSFDELVKTKGDDAATCLLFSERAGRSLLEISSAWPVRPQRITALVGPEGGWDKEELAQAAAHDWQLVTLGGRTLRAETAAIVAIALLQHLCGDLV